ncbi:protein of unknown function [Magnetospirillum sp. XM-1]|nr:protein of unknown function [Magnetospirillum sp. XM-1]
MGAVPVVTDDSAVDFFAGNGKIGRGFVVFQGDGGGADLALDFSVLFRIHFFLHAFSVLIDANMEIMTAYIVIVLELYCAFAVIA